MLLVYTVQFTCRPRLQHCRTCIHFTAYSKLTKSHLAYFTMCNEPLAYCSYGNDKMTNPDFSTSFAISHLIRSRVRLSVYMHVYMQPEVLRNIRSM